MHFVTALHISPGIQSYFFVLLLSVHADIGSITWIPSQTQAAMAAVFLPQQSRLMATCINHTYNLIASYNPSYNPSLEMPPIQPDVLPLVPSARACMAGVGWK